MEDDLDVENGVGMDSASVEHFPEDSQEDVVEDAREVVMQEVVEVNTKEDKTSHKHGMGG